MKRCLLLALLLVGCSSQAPTTEKLHGKVVIKGSNTFGEQLGQALIDDYRKGQPDVAIELESKGSDTGFKALLANQCDIGASSRLADEDELRQARSRQLTLVDSVIGSYGVAVIVNTRNPVQDLSLEQVRDLFAGKITNWKAVGGPDAPVHTYIRDPISGTSLGFRELTMDTLPYAADAKTFRDYEGQTRAVEHDPNGIGYSGMHLVSKTVRAITVQKIEPNAMRVNQGAYPYARTVRLYTVKEHETPLARDFIRYVQSARGQSVVVEMGYVQRLDKPLMPAPSE